MTKKSEPVCLYWVSNFCQLMNFLAVTSRPDSLTKLFRNSSEILLEILWVTLYEILQGLFHDAENQTDTYYIRPPTEQILSVEQTNIFYVDIVLYMFALVLFMNQHKFLINLVSSPLKALMTAKKFFSPHSWPKFLLSQYKQMKSNKTLRFFQCHCNFLRFYRSYEVFSSPQILKWKSFSFWTNMPIMFNSILCTFTQLLSPDVWSYRDGNQ